MVPTVSWLAASVAARRAAEISLTAMAGLKVIATSLSFIIFPWAQEAGLDILNDDQSYITPPLCAHIEDASRMLHYAEKCRHVNTIIAR